MSGARLECTAVRIVAAVSAALLIAAAGGCTAQPPPPDEWESRFAALEAFSRSMLYDGAPAVLAEVRYGGKVWTHAAGVRSLDAQEAAMVSDPFQAGSITSSMVAVSVLKLVEEGRLGLDDQVSTYLPEFWQVLHPPGPVTVRRLLVHQSGVPDFAIPLMRSGPPQDVLARPLSLEQQLALAATMPWEPKLAQGPEYSSSNYAALGLIVQRLRGRGIGAVLKADIADPLGLVATRLGGGPPPATMIHGYLMVDGKRLDVTHPAWLSELASGGAISTVGEVNAFYAALQQGKLLTPATVAGMRGPDRAVFGQGLWKWNDTCTNRFYYGNPGDTDGYGMVSMTSEDGMRQLTLAVAYPPEPPTLNANPLIFDMQDVAQETLNSLC